MSDIRPFIRKQTNYLHKRLDHQYPYNKLLDNDSNIDLVVNHYLLCFKLTFQNFLYFKKEENEFYNFSYRFFSKFEEQIETEENILIDNFDMISLEYLFLGSRLGNKIILKRNPKLRSTVGSPFFTYDDEESLFASLDSKFLEFSVYDRETLMLISKIKFYYNLLISLGLLLNRN